MGLTASFASVSVIAVGLLMTAGLLAFALIAALGAVLARGLEEVQKNDPGNR